MRVGIPVLHEICITKKDMKCFSQCQFFEINLVEALGEEVGK